VWFDSHCHLHLCDEGAASDVVARARAAGVEDLLSVGIDLSSSRTSVEIANECQVYASVGLHPNSSDEWKTDSLASLTDLLEMDRVVAVGETGLDFYRDRVGPTQQKEVFARHIELAKDHEKALVVHTRDSIDDALDVLMGQGPPAVVIFHCWSGSRAQLDKALDLASYVSFAGNVSFKNADDLRELASAVPDDRLLIETDSPFLAPVPHRGKPNEPRYLPAVGVAVADARGVSVETLAAQTRLNSRRAFSLGHE
jgi:TatD DNase family protein